jgi:8-oxo-dGTP pyrophosphatase MutT (NUDIX family)
MKDQVGTAVILHTDTHVWLRLRENSKEYAGYWEVPGGKSEGDESPFDAACRELYEETGLSPVIHINDFHSEVHPLTLPGGCDHSSLVPDNFGWETFWYKMKLDPKASFRLVPESREPEKASDWLMLRAESCRHLKMMPGLQEAIAHMFRLTLPALPPSIDLKAVANDLDYCINRLEYTLDVHTPEKAKELMGMGETVADIREELPGLKQRLATLERTIYETTKT